MQRLTRVYNGIISLSCISTNSLTRFSISIEVRSSSSPLSSWSPTDTIAYVLQNQLDIDYATFQRFYRTVWSVMLRWSRSQRSGISTGNKASTVATTSPHNFGNSWRCLRDTENLTPHSILIVFGDQRKAETFCLQQFLSNETSTPQIERVVALSVRSIQSPFEGKSAIWHKIRSVDNIPNNAVKVLKIYHVDKKRGHHHRHDHLIEIQTLRDYLYFTKPTGRSLRFILTVSPSSMVSDIALVKLMASWKWERVISNAKICPHSLGNLWRRPRNAGNLTPYSGLSLFGHKEKWNLLGPTVLRYWAIHARNCESRRTQRPIH